MAKKLWKTTIVIWSEDDPQDMELSDLAREAESGSSICTKCVSGFVEHPDEDPDWDGNEFFDDPDSESEDDDGLCRSAAENVL